MEHIAKIGDYITVPDCSTAGTVKKVWAVAREAIGQDPMLVYEIETTQGRMCVPADWLARLVRP